MPCFSEGEPLRGDPAWEQRRPGAEEDRTHPQPHLVQQPRIVELAHQFPAAQYPDVLSGMVATISS
jgi:hypothetical protein